MKMIQHRNQKDHQTSRRIKTEHDSFFGGPVKCYACEPAKKKRRKGLEDTNRRNSSGTVCQFIHKPEQCDPVQVFPDLGNQLSGEEKSEIFFLDQRQRFVHVLFPMCSEGPRR